AAERKAVSDGVPAETLRANASPDKLDPEKVDKSMTILVMMLLMISGILTYAPLAAMLTEMFPARIRYTSMSLPYHVGNGFFGGLLPASVFAIGAATGNVYAGL